MFIDCIRQVVFVDHKIRGYCMSTKALWRNMAYQFKFGG